jgi:DNA-binding transcriptional ArsR family regulator
MSDETARGKQASAVRLTMPDGSDQLIPLDDEVTSIGRHPTNSVTVEDPSVSRTHLTIARAGAQIKVCDESTYGTRLQGALLVPQQPIRVHHSQFVTFGGDDQSRYRITVEDPSELPPTQAPKHNPGRIRLSAQHRRIAEALVHQYLERRSAAPRAATVDEMAERLEVHPSTIRRGLTELESLLKLDTDLRGPNRLHALADRILTSDAHRA